MSSLPSQTSTSRNAGAQFYKCAFQVNPHSYGRTYRGKPTDFDEAGYARALIDKAEALDIGVLAVTDHNSVSGVDAIRAVAQERNIVVFPGFELTTTEGIHVLCLYAPNTPTQRLERLLGECGIRDTNLSSDPCGKAFSTVLATARHQGGTSIAAHATTEGGLFKALKGRARISLWKDENLHAIQIPGSIEDLPQEVREIVLNRDPHYAREHTPEPEMSLAVVNARDVTTPEDLEHPGATCWVKMSELSIEGLRQAFLDPGSRIRLAAPEPDEHAELVEMRWEGGFLDGVSCRFNPNLNVLVGGRGAGKSTVVESLRYVLNLRPLGREARSNHEGIVEQALKSGTKVSIVVRSHRPSVKSYRIERTVPNPSVVRDAETGQVLNVSVSDIFSGIEVYGQHEVAELARSPQKLTSLLDRFVAADVSFATRKRELAVELKQSRESILRTREELAANEEELAALPGLEETQVRYREAGIEADLKERSLLVREKGLLDTVSERIALVREGQESLKEGLPIDRRFLSLRAIEALPGKKILAKADSTLEILSDELKDVMRSFEAAVDRADENMRDIKEQFAVRSMSVQTAYEQKLRELQRSKIDGEEFIELRTKIEALRPLDERQQRLKRQESELLDRRRNLLAEWEDVHGQEFRALDGASKRVNRKLSGRARVRVEFSGDREPLFVLLREHIGGRLSEAIRSLRAVTALSPKALAQACRGGAGELGRTFGISGVQAERLAGATSEALMHVEEVALAATTDIELNVAAPGEQEDWRRLAALSTGQKATAVLLLLLLHADAPLVVDQPEDDLDNRFITEGIVPRMRDGKQRRQFVFTTHNANIPVLGDAELILGLTPSGEAEGGSAAIRPEHRGSIDVDPVRQLVEELLEGGADAFERRRQKYGF